MAGLCASLTVLGVLFNVPLGTNVQRSGWRHHAPGSHERLGLLDIQQRTEARSFGVPVRDFGLPDKPAVVAESEQPAEEAEAEESAKPMALEGLEALPVMEFADFMPDIQGGIGAYYINIEYPEAARHRGIEGRLVLFFVVEPDGRPSNISVGKSLHPLCDSAAVQALRQTVFIPGHHNGKPVRVRMRLPVSFQLLDPVTQDSTAV